MELLISSPTLGRDVVFSRPGASHIFVDLNGQPGTLGHQICRGGRLYGEAITYEGDCEERFRAICNYWIGKYRDREDLGSETPQSDHPFHKGVVSATDRVARARSMTREQCLEALQMTALQKTVIMALERRLRELQRLRAEQKDS